MEENWPFGEPPNVAVITTTRIVHDGLPILLVSNDEDGWQFLDGEDVSEDVAMIVSLKNIVGRDASIRQLADLPVGWQAWRESENAAWQRIMQ